MKMLPSVEPEKLSTRRLVYLVTDLCRMRDDSGPDAALVRALLRRVPSAIYQRSAAAPLPAQPALPSPQRE